MKYLILILAAAPLVVAPALAQDDPVTLKRGPGQDVTRAGCMGCHSLDYIEMNSVFLTPEGWQAEVNKMRQAFGAPIDGPTAEAIVRYLSATYAVAPKS